MSNQVGREVKVPLLANCDAAKGDTIEIVDSKGKVVAVGEIISWIVGGGAVIIALVRIVVGGL